MKRFKKWSSFLLSLCMILALFPAVTSPVNAASASAKYKDVVQTEWYVPYVDYVVEHGLMSGTSSTTFVPNGKVTRAQYVQVLYAFAGKPAGAKAAGFTDVKAGTWYVNAVNWAASVGVTGGMTKTTFAPDRPVTREQAATFFRAYAEKVAEVTVDENKELSSFPDQASVSKYAVIPMKWAVGAGLISGIKSSGKVILSPQGTLTRAQLATMMKAFDQYLVGKNTTNYDNGDIVYHPDLSSLVLDLEQGEIYYNDLINVFTFGDLSTSEAKQLADSVGGTIVTDISGTINMLQIKIKESSLQEIEKLCEKILENEKVFYASSDMPREMSSSSNENPWSDNPQKPDTDIGNENNPDGNDWWAEAIHAYSAWNQIDQMSEVKYPVVGVLDEGFDVNHEDLKGVISFPRLFTKNTLTPGDDDKYVEGDHGTEVAGLIGAINNKKGIRGVASGSKMLCADYYNGFHNSIDTGEYIEIIRTFVESGAKVINNSWGIVILPDTTSDYFKYLYAPFNILIGITEEGIYDQLEKNPNNELLINKMQYNGYLGLKVSEIIKSAFFCAMLVASLIDSNNSDFLICQSAGNGLKNSKVASPFNASYNGYFASITEEIFNTLPALTRSKLGKKGIRYEQIQDHIMIVGAASKEKTSVNCYKAADFSNFGDAVDIYAPGVDVLSTYPEDRYRFARGTSFSCPIVSGAAALLWAAKPDLTAREVKSALVNHYTKIVEENVTGLGKPMLDVGLALRSVLGNQYVEPDNTVLPNGFIQIRNAQELSAIRNNLTGKYILMNDIDLSSYGNWTPIGDIKNPFTGTFDGNGHKIHNMKITDNEIRPSEITVIDDQHQLESSVAGLFGCTSSASIKNIASVTGSIVQKYSDSGEWKSVTVGGIAGVSINTSITGCSTDVDILYQYGEPGKKPTTDLIQAFQAGGIAGTSGAIEGDSVIQNCSAYGNITVTTHQHAVCVGGVAGASGEGARIENCYSRCNIDAKTDSIFIYLGGILGSSSTSQDILTINNCCSNTTIKYAAGNEQGKKYEDSYYSVYVGGVTGYDKNNSNLNISNCFYLASSARGATGWADDCLKDGEKIVAHIDAKACSQSEINNKAKEMGFAV